MFSRTHGVSNVIYSSCEVFQGSLDTKLCSAECWRGHSCNTEFIIGTTLQKDVIHGQNPEKSNTNQIITSKDRRSKGWVFSKINKEDGKSYIFPSCIGIIFKDGNQESIFSQSARRRTVT